MLGIHAMASDGDNHATEDPLEHRLAEHEKWLAQRVAQGKSGAVTLALLHGETGDSPRVVHLYAPDPLHIPESNAYVGKTLSTAELETVCAEHSAWLDSEGRTGRRACLMQANLRCLPGTPASKHRAELRQKAEPEAPKDDARLDARPDAKANAQHPMPAPINLMWAHMQKANLSERELIAANFEGALLQEANLSGCNLKRAVFRGASLKGADLSGADVSLASFAGADLTNTNFHLAKGLRSLELSGVDLSQARGVPAVTFAGLLTEGCKLPADTLDGLAHVSDASRNARTVFQLMLLACLYCVLTVLSVTDQQVITNVGRIPLKLPILDVEISLRSFFFSAPVLLISMLVYLHLYLRHVWAGAARMPARFPDGTGVGDRTSPWIMTALIDCYHLPKPTPSGVSRSFITRCQEAAALVLGFWTVPVTVGLLAGRYLTRQSPEISEFLAGYLWISILIAAAFQVSMMRTLRAVPELPEAAGDDTPQRPAAPKGRTRMLFGALTLLLMAATHVGVRNELVLSLFGPELPVAAPPPNAQNPSAQTASAAQTPADEDAWGSDKLYFSGRSLIGAHGKRAYLKKAILTGANLSLAELRGATLRYADLTAANLHCADLSAADLRDVLGLTQNMLNDACGDGRTKLPAGFTGPTACPADCKTPRQWRTTILGLLPSD